MSAENNAPWNEDEVAMAKSIMVLHSQPVEEFQPVKPAEEFMNTLRSFTTPQLQWVLMEILSTVRRRGKEITH